MNLHQNKLKNNLHQNKLKDNLHQNNIRIYYYGFNK